MQAGFVQLSCARCGVAFARKTGHVNRSRKASAPLYCGRVCTGLSRRNPNPPTEAERKEAKRLYDAKRLAERNDELCAKKMAHYYANRDRILAKQVVYRAKHMPRHVAYCQRPEYRAWKAEYDRQYNARHRFGEFADAFLLLQDIEKEIDARATRQEIYQANGTFNKAQTRRRSL